MADELRARTDEGWFRILRLFALTAMLAGAAAAVAITLYAGRKNNSHLLMCVFAVWVLSPFVALTLVSSQSTGWLRLMRIVLHSVMLLITLATLVIYSYVAFGPPRPQAAFAFLVTPLASWLIAGAVVAAATLMSSKSAQPPVTE